MNRDKEDILRILTAMIQKVVQETGCAWPRWMPSRMASRYSGLSVKTLRKLAREGEIYAASVNGGKLLFDRESIDEYLLRNRAEIKLRLDELKKSIL